MMKAIKELKDFTVYQKRSGRYAVRSKDRKWIRGPEKVKILVEQGLIKAALPKAVEKTETEETAPEAPAS